jgi:hypothetical protein
MVYELLKCLLRIHTYKTIGFDISNTQGQFEVRCEYCRSRYWTNDPPESVVTKLIEADRRGDFKYPES